MIRAILLDMDDTLLHYPQGTDAFVRRYLELAEAFFAQEVGEPNIGAVLRRAVRQTIASQDPTRRNDSFYQQAVSTHLHTAFERFHETAYPQLARMAQPIPHAAAMIADLRERGYEVVIATNPLFPQKPIEQRLEWAGIDPALPTRITHGGNSHFTKPSPHYYEEIMAELDYEPYEAIMVGDNWQNDILPAAQTGMATFWIHNPHSQPDTQYQADGAGSLHDFWNCVQSGWLESLPPKPLLPDHIPPRLTGGVAALWGKLETMPERFWAQRPDPAEWSPLEIVAHLAEYERDPQRPTLQKIANEDNPFLRTPPTPPQPGERPLDPTNGWSLARQFAAERAETLAFLATVSAWARPARHSIYGPTTLLEMANFAARHDKLHIKQLCQTIGKCE